MSWFQWLGTGGGATAIGVLVYLWPTIQRMRADAGRARTEAAVLADQADDEHWRQIVEAQTEALVKPLREEVASLRSELASVRQELREVRAQREQDRHRYRAAIGYIRVCLAWIRRHHGEPMDLPVVPSEIAGDI